MTEENTPLVSFDPDDFSEGGLPIVGATVALEDPRFAMLDFTDEYSGDNLSRPVFSVMLNDNDTGKAYGYEGGPSYYGVGNANDWMVDEDGNLIPAVEGKTINKNTKFGYFMRGLKDAGFPTDRLKSGDISVLANTVCVMHEVPYKDRDGETRKRTGRDGKEYDDKVVVPQAVIALPEEYEKDQKKGKAGKTSAKPATGSKGKAAASKKKDDAAPADNPEVMKLTVDTITELFNDNGGESLPMNGLVGKVMKKLITSKFRNDVIKFVDKSFDDVLVAAVESGAPWIAVDDEIVAAGE